LSCNGRYTRNARYGSNLAPVRQVKFFNPIVDTHFAERESLIDSGASATFIPADVADELALVELRRSPVFDFQGNPVGTKPVYVVTITCDTLSHNVQAIETDGFPIIGRDILNTLDLTLRGTQQRWEMG